MKLRFIMVNNGCNESNFSASVVMAILEALKLFRQTSCLCSISNHRLREWGPYAHWAAPQYDTFVNLGQRDRSLPLGWPQRYPSRWMETFHLVGLSKFSKVMKHSTWFPQKLFKLLRSISWNFPYGWYTINLPGGWQIPSIWQLFFPVDCNGQSTYMVDKFCLLSLFTILQPNWTLPTG